MGLNLRTVLAGAAVPTGLVVHFMPTGWVTTAATVVGITIAAGLAFAIGATRERRPTPGVYYRAEPYEPAVTAIHPARGRRPLHRGRRANDTE